MVDINRQSWYQNYHHLAKVGTKITITSDKK